MTTPKRPECDWCRQPAVGELFAQWTVADFGTRLACQDHLTQAEFDVMRHRVDGLGVADMRWTYFERVDSSDYAF